MTPRCLQTAQPENIATSERLIALRVPPVNIWLRLEALPRLVASRALPEIMQQELATPNAFNALPENGRTT